jgi:hypothetical protein
MSKVISWKSDVYFKIMKSYIISCLQNHQHFPTALKNKTRQVSLVLHIRFTHLAPKGAGVRQDFLQCLWGLLAYRL